MIQWVSRSRPNCHGILHPMDDQSKMSNTFYGRPLKDKLYFSFPIICPFVLSLSVIRTSSPFFFLLNTWPNLAYFNNGILSFKTYGTWSILVGHVVLPINSRFPLLPSLFQKFSSLKFVI